MGPLQGVKVVEIAGIGPGPFCGMLLADMGADIVRIERPGGDRTGISIPEQFNVLNRGRRSLTVDLRSADGVAFVLTLCRKADVLIEGFRPGVMEDFGLGPSHCMAVNKRLVYGRVTGWGQEGPLSQSAGHDGNYGSIVGVINAIGAADGPPVVPLNLVGDYGGGGAYLAIGVLAALLEAERSGYGQVVDAAMVDGAASLMSVFYGLRAAGIWQDERASNLLDGAAPFYRPYRTKDDKYVFVGAIESRFFSELLSLLDIVDIPLQEQHDRAKWPAHASILARTFATKRRDEWAALFDGTDACVAPVLSLDESPHHPHNVARETFIEIDGVVQPAPAPRFSRTGSDRPGSSKAADAQDILESWGLTP